MVGFVLMLGLALLIGAAEAGVRHPVVFVPGIGGSVLESRLNVPAETELPHWICPRMQSGWKRIWLRLTDLVPVEIDCTLFYLSMRWDAGGGGGGKNATKLLSHWPSPQDGVEITAPRFGSVYATEYLDPNVVVSHLSEYFHPLIKALSAKGFVDKVSMFAAPFDWRWWPFDSWVADTKDLIERAYALNGEKRVVLVSHSMGGPFTYVFLMQQTQEWKDKFIESWVSASAPWTGTPLALVAMLTGYAFDLPISQAKAASLARSLPSVYFLLPNPDFGYWAKRVVVETPDRNFTGAEIADVLTTVADVPWASTAVAHVRSFFDPYNYGHPHVNVSIFVSKGTSTVTGLRYKSMASLLEARSLPDVVLPPENEDNSSTLSSSAEKLHGDGDGTVDLESLEFACERWGEKCIVLDKVTHFSTIKNAAVIDHVLSAAAS